MKNLTIKYQGIATKIFPAHSGGWNSDALGIYDCSKNRILVFNGQEAGQMKDSVMHELFHMILFRAGSPHCRNEPLVNTLASGTLALLRDNPSLVKYLTERIK